MAATVTNVKLADQEILNILRDRGAPVSPDEVTRSAKVLGHAESEIFSAIWYLIDRGKIKLTIDLKLQVA